MNYLIFLIALLPILSYSQPVITSSVYPPEGIMIELFDCQPEDVQENNVGANITWDFSDLDAFPNIVSLTFEESSGSTFDSIFPEANKVIRRIQNQDTIYEFNSLNDLELEKVGLVFEDSNGTLILDYSNSETITKFPVTFEDTWIDSFAFSFNGSSDFMGTSTSEVDGYGTLILPNGTYDNVIRIHSIWSAPGWNDEVHQYIYYTPDYYYNLLSMIDDEFEIYYQSNPIPVVTSSIEEKDNSINVRISPNPVSNNSDLKIEIETASTVDIKVFSINGQILLSQIGVDFTGGVHYLKLEKYLESGYYVIQLVADEIIYNKKVLVQ